MSPQLDEPRPGAGSGAVSWARGSTLERLLYAACLATAAALRFGDLGARPLDRHEAASAWPAWALALTGEGPMPAASDPPTSALLFSLHWLSFWLAGGATDALARWPGAAVGTGLVLLPWALRALVGPVSALALAGILAIDPLLVGASRTADGAILSAFCTMLALVCLARLGAGVTLGGGAFARRFLRRLAAVAVGLLLVSGTAAWGLLLLGAIGVGFRPAPESSSASRPAPPLSSMGWVLLAAVLAATSGFAQWDGLPSVSSSLTAWLGDWRDDLTAGKVITLGAALIRTQPLLVLLPLLGLVSVWTSRPRPARRGLVLAAALIALAGLLAVGRARAPAAGLPLVLALALAAALASGPLAVRTMAWVRQGTPGRATAGWIWIAATAFLVLVTLRGAVAEGGRAAPLGPRLLARDVTTLCAWRDRPGPCRIDVVATPWLDPVLAWYLRDFSGVRWILSPAPARSGAAPPFVIAPADEGDGANTVLVHAWPIPYAGSPYRTDSGTAGRGGVVLWVPGE